MKLEHINDYDNFGALLRCEISCFQTIVRKRENGSDGKPKRSSNGKRSMHDRGIG